jgi:hypothetical protein
MEHNAHLAHFFRYLWEDAGLLIVLGDGEKLVEGYQTYNAQYGIASATGERLKAVKHLMTAAGLAAVSLSERESWGWSLNLPNPEYGLFCASEPEGMLSVRVVDSRNTQGRAVVQRQKAGEDLTQSHYTLETDDPIEAVQRYFEESAQEALRIGVLADGRGALVKALPGGRFGEVANLSKDEMVKLCYQLAAQDGKLKKLDEVLQFYMCRCNEEMILNMITGLPKAERDTLWDEHGALTAECPRCARAFTVRKQG